MVDADLKKNITTTLSVNVIDRCTRLLGTLCYDGIPVDPSEAIGSGFLPSSGQIAMKGDINLEDPDTPGVYYIVNNLADPTLPNNLNSKEALVKSLEYP